MNFKSADFAPAHEYSVQFNGVEVPIEIETDETGPSSQQLQALAQALSLASDVLETSAPAVVQNYEVYRELMGEIGDEMPALENSVDVWKQVEPTNIYIPPHEAETPPSFLLNAECDWDPEHGLVVRFRNGVADAASQQGELGIED